MRGGAKRTQFTLKKLCDQFVHSFVFFPFVAVERPLGVFYSSDDHIKKNTVYYMRLVDIIEVFWAVGRDDWQQLELCHDGSASFIRLPE